MADRIIETLNRCLSLVPLVRQHQGITLDELARRAHSTREQVLEDLTSTLLMCGVPPYFPHDYLSFALEGDRVFLSFADHFRRPVSLDALEAMALKLACESTAMPGARPAPAVQSVLRKVEDGMAPKQRALFNALCRRGKLSEDGEQPRHAIRTRLAEALFDRKLIEIEYVPGGGDQANTWKVQPFGGLCLEGHWYLVGRVQGKEDTQTFRQDRLRRVQVLQESFELPAGFSLQQFSQTRLLENQQLPTASIRFRGTAARWIRECAETGSIETLAAHDVRWHPPIAQEEALARLLLSWGFEFEIEAPTSLRECVVRLLGAAAKAHA